MLDIKQHYQIHAPIKDVWQALIDPLEIEAWGGGPAQMSDKVGAKFKLWGGDIWGKNVEVISCKKLVQEWYGGDWDKPSLVTFKLRQAGLNVGVELVHTGVPKEEVADIDQGWKDFYLGPMKDYLESQ